MFCVLASKCHLFADFPQPEQLVNDLATNAECREINQNGN